MPSRIFPGRTERPDWNNPQCVERNRFPRHAYLVQFPDQQTCEEAIENNRRYLSPSIHMLNGRWDFKLFDAIQQMPDNIFAYRSGFDTIEVPSSWDISKLIRRRGLRSRDPSRDPNRDQIISVSPDAGERSDWPFPLNPPLVPEDIPVGVYHRSVQLPTEWGNVRKRIVFHAVQSSFHLVINGRIAGYAQNGRITNEFDVTPLIHNGTNEIFVLVYAFSSGSYLNGQANFQKPGILGDVYFEAVAPVSIFDLNLKTFQPDPALTGNWRLEISATAISYKVSLEKHRVWACLKKDGQTLHEAEAMVEPIPSPAIKFDKAVQRVGQVKFSFDDPDITPWSDETPEIYDLFLTCLDSAGREISCVHQAFGFRELGWQDGRLQLNHKPLQLIAVNFRIHDEIHGSVWTLPSLVRDLRLIKQQHFNAIRLAHGPVDPLIYELCTSLGIYVLPDQAIQPLPDWQACSRDERSCLKELWEDGQWQLTLEDRIHNLVVRDRNQTSLLAWPSIVANPRKTDVFDSAVDPFNAIILSQDDSRPLVHLIIERQDSGQSAASYAATDEYLLKTGSTDRLPVIEILNPLLSLAGGGSASLTDSIDLLNAYSQYSGLICGHWDDVRSLAHSRHDKRFAAALAAIRRSTRPMAIKPLDLLAGQLQVRNLNRYLSLDQYRMHWQIKCNGLMVVAGEFDCPDIAAGESNTLTIDYGPIDFSPAFDYTLHLTLHLIQANLWMAADTVVQIENFQICVSNSVRDPYLGALQPVISSSKHKLRLEQDRHLLVISGHRFWLVFNRITAMIESWRCGDHELLSFAPATHAAHRGSFGSPIVFWRPFQSQDQPWQEVWQKAGLDRLMQTVDAVHFECDGQQAQITVSSRYGPAGEKPLILVKTHYTIMGDGQVMVAIQVATEGLCSPLDLPRIGFRLHLRRQFDRIIWSGQGPDPTWPCSQAMAYTGQFSQKLEELTPVSSHPGQEWAPHAGTRWAALVDAKGIGLLCESEDHYVFHARDYLLEDLLENPADQKLIRQNLVEFNIDFHFKPVGGISESNNANRDSTTRICKQLTFTPMTGFH